MINMPEKHYLDYFFFPESVAVVGASNNPGKAGFQVIKNLTRLGYEGRVYPVNPQERQINGVPCYSSLSEIKDKVDLVVITAPARSVIPVVREAAARGDIRAIVVVSAGFRETKTEEGVKMEKELVEVARQAGIRLFGPNCTGVINTSIKLDTTIEPTVEQVPGGVSIFSQSGAMAGSILLFAESQPRPLGFSKWAHVGNMCDVNTLDVISYYGHDPTTKVVGIYMEGFDQGRKLIEVAGGVTPHKPVLVLKVGRNDLGAKAAYSHTGALAGRDEVYEAAFKRCGITRVQGLRELIDTAKAMSMQPLPGGNRICILTEAGGPGTMAMDELGRCRQARLASISETGRQKLKKALPPIAIICQPDGYIDITAAAMEEHHGRSLKIVLEEEEVDAVVLISVPPTFLPPESLAGELIRTARNCSKPVLTCLLAGKWVHEARRMLENEGLPTFDTPEQAVRAMVNMIERSRYLQRISAGRGGTSNG